MEGFCPCSWDKSSQMWHINIGFILRVFNCWEGQVIWLFSKASRVTVGSAQLPFQWAPGVVSRCARELNWLLTTMCAEQGWPETCGSPRQSNNWNPFKPTFFERFQLRTGLANLFFRAHVKIADNFCRNSFACGNLSLLAPYFWIFWWHLSTSCGLMPCQLPGWPTAQSGPCAKIKNACSYASTPICCHALHRAHFTFYRKNLKI
jgi:hypothetical protein